MNGPPSSESNLLQHIAASHRSTGGRPTLRLPVRGLQPRTCLLHWLSVLRNVCPAHCHFSLTFILTAMKKVKPVIVFQCALFRSKHTQRKNLTFHVSPFYYSQPKGSHCAKSVLENNLPTMRFNRF